MVKRLLDVIEADFVGSINNKMNLGQLKRRSRSSKQLWPKGLILIHICEVGI